MINMIDCSELHIQICQCFFLILGATFVVFDQLRNRQYYSCETNENTLSLNNKSSMAIFRLYFQIQRENTYQRAWLC